MTHHGTRSESQRGKGDAAGAARTVSDRGDRSGVGERNARPVRAVKACLIHNTLIPRAWDRNGGEHTG